MKNISQLFYQKKISKIVNIIFLAITLFYIFPKNIVKAEGLQKGDLRCPINSSNCEEIKDNNGNTIKVNVTYGSIKNDGDIQIVKTVEKTENLGRYKVYFTIKGKNVSQAKKRKDVYIVLLMDASKTIVNNISNAITAIKKFALDLIPLNDDSSNYNLALINFAGHMSSDNTRDYIVSRDFNNANFETTNLCTYAGEKNCFCSYKKNEEGDYDPICSNIGKKSEIEDAFDKIYSMLIDTNIPSDSLKYVILYGDGRYWDDNDTDIKYVKENANKLKNAGVKIFGVQYKGSSLDELASENSAKFAGSFPERMHIDCDTSLMKQLTTTSSFPYYQTSSNSSNLNDYFTTIKTEIESELGEDNITTSSELIDWLGEKFNFVNNSQRYKKMSIEKITNEGINTESFYIEIDEYANDGWHDTNDGFTFTYTDINGVEKEIKSMDNPEVYWIAQKKEINSCSGVATYDSILNRDTEQYSYYEIMCQEGYLKNNVYNQGLSVDININDLRENTRKFNTGGFGFPAKIKLSTNLICQYKFDYEKFNTDYRKYVNSCNEITSKEQASMCKSKLELENILNNYINNSNNNLLDYETRFKEQTATLKVMYNSLNSTELTSFVNVGEVRSDIKCEEVLKKIINGKEVIVSQKCYASFSKDMGLKKSCLDMKTGEQVNCTGNNTQINGGNKFYADLKAKGGQIFVSINNVGISENLNFQLKDCSFESNKIDYDVIYRQIDLTDPFLQSYDNNRGIGKNYSNNKYNFVNIIKSDIWDQNFMYRYQISKSNVDKIIKDTNEEGVNSYLGRNCYFTSDNKYICDFTRNKVSSDGVSNQTDWFTKAEINN